MKKQFCNKRARKPLDLALVIGLKEMIKRMKRLELKPDEIEIIEKFEKGPRRQAIQHIRATMNAQELGLRTADPRPKGSDCPLALGKVFDAGRHCPACKEGVLVENTIGARKRTVCDHCDFLAEHITLSFDPVTHRDVTEFLAKRRKHEIISEWIGLNDPHPPKYASVAA